MPEFITRRGYHEDHKSFGKFLKSEQHLAPARKAAGDIMDIARATAPIGNSRKIRGRLRTRAKFITKFRVREQPSLWKNTTGGHPNPRRIMLVENTAAHAAAVEFGNRRTPAHRTLAKAGAMVGELRSKLGA